MVSFNLQSIRIGNLGNYGNRVRVRMRFWSFTSSSFRVIFKLWLSFLACTPGTGATMLLHRGSWIHFFRNKAWSLSFLSMLIWCHLVFFFSFGICQEIFLNLILSRILGPDMIVAMHSFGKNGLAFQSSS